MGSWSYIPIPDWPDQGIYTGDVDGLAVLTDGRLFVMCQRPFIVTPGPDGGYTTAPTFEFIEVPSTGSRLYFSNHVLNDGRYLMLGSEYYSGVNRMQAWDPETGHWTEPAIETSISHLASTVLDDGRIFSSNGHFVDPDTLAITSAPDGFANEAPLCLLPDGSVLNVQVLFSGSKNNPYQRFRPNYSQPFVDAGSVDGDDTYSAAVTPTNLTSPYHASQAPAGRAMCNVGDTGYEWGPVMWLPHLQKAALIDGNGAFWTYDRTLPSGQEWAVVHEPAVGSSTLPSTPLVVASVDAGKTVAQIIAQPSLSLAPSFGYEAIDLVSTFPPGGQVFVETAQGREYAFRYNDSPVRDPLTGIHRFSQVFVSAGGFYSNTSDTLTAGGDTSNRSLRLKVQDGWGFVLPSGRVLCSVGRAVEGGTFNGPSTWVVWDGGTSVTQQGWVDRMGPMGPYGKVLVGRPSANYSTVGCILPTGQVALRGYVEENQFAANTHMHPYIWLYTPDASDGVVPSNFKPVISSFPSIVKSGFTYTLSGTQLSGLTQGSYYGDDEAGYFNFPLVRFTNLTSGATYYAKTFGFTYRGIQAGRASSCQVRLKAMPPGNYEMQVVSNGIGSTPMPVAVTGGDAAPVAALARGALSVGRSLAGRMSTSGGFRSHLGTRIPMGGRASAAVVVRVVSRVYGDGTYGSQAYGELTPPVATAGRLIAAATARGVLDFFTAFWGEMNASAVARSSGLSRLTGFVSAARVALGLTGQLGFASHIPSPTPGVEVSTYDLAPRFNRNTAGDFAAEFRLEGIQPEDPTTVEAFVMSPAGTVSPLDVTRASRGVYVVTVLFDEVGEWTIRFVGTDPVPVAVEQMVVVRHARMS